MNERSVLKLAAPASFQKLGDGAVILMADSGQLYSSNETAEAFLSHVDGEKSLGTIIDLMEEEYDVERAVLADDVLSLAGELRSEGVVEVVASEEA